MARKSPFRFRIDHKQQTLVMAATTRGGRVVSANLDIDQIINLIAVLSQSQYALLRTSAGVKTDLPFNPALAFETLDGRRRVGTFERVRRLAINVDDSQGLVMMTLLSGVGRLCDYRMSREAARKLGRALLGQVEKAAPPRTLQ